MPITIETPVIGPLYFRSFASYEIPLRPIEPIEFGETERLRSYYLAYKDQSGRIIRFEKIRVVRVEKEPRQLDLPVTTAPGSSIYFAIGATGEPVSGRPLGYSDIKSIEEDHLASEEYFAGEVEPSGRTCSVVHVRCERVFRELYRYWPNGSLRERTKIISGKPPSNEYYDKDGKPIAECVS